MVSAIQHYYLRLNGTERGPFTLNQIASMWSSGALTADTLYRVTNVENWTPLSQLDDTLRFVSSSRPVQEAGNTPAPLPSPPPPILDAIQIEKRIAARKAALAAIDPTGEKGKLVQAQLQSILALGDPCWFSGLASRADASFQAPLYFLTYESLLGRRKEWRELTVGIPRSPEADRLHRRQYFARYLSTWAGGIVLGLASAYWAGIYCVFWFAGGLLLGNIVGFFVSPSTPPNWKPFGDWKKHPKVAARLAEGWSDRRPR